MGKLLTYFWAKNGIWAGCLKNIDFGPKTKQLRIRGDVIDLFVISPSIQDLLAECYLLFFLKSTAWDQNWLWGFKEWTRKPNFLCFAFLLMKLSNYIMGNKRHLPFPSSTLCVVSDQTSIDHMLFQWVLDATQLFLMKMKNVGKQTIFDSLAFFVLRGQSCKFQLATLRQNLKLDLSLCLIYC